MSYNGGYSDEEYSDDEYAPLELSSWGTQAVTQDGKTEVNVSMDGWQSLIDPSVKLKAGGVGSGQLHRRGGNFKPLDEQLIIQQRLGKPIPKALGGGKKKRGGKPKSSAPPPRRPVPSSMAPPSSSQYRFTRGRNTITPSNNVWGNGELASTPFWEQSAASVTTGTYASKYASPPPPTQQQQAPPPPLQQQQQQQQPLVAPAAPVHQPEPPAAFTPTRLGTAASKYATPAPVPQTQYQPQQPLQQQPMQQQQPIHQSIHQQSPAIYHKLEQPVLTINIEISEGINAKMLVYENDEPADAVDQFERNHHLTMDITAKQRFAEQVGLLLEQYKSNQ